MIRLLKLFCFLIKNMSYKIEVVGFEDQLSDGYHTFDELYKYRMLYNAAFVNEYVKTNPEKCFKSTRHSDGIACFGGGWFVVSVNLPTGQVNNHYKIKHWYSFKCKSLYKAYEWDGHTPAQAAERLELFLQQARVFGA